MINFRYHLASLVAVFLALALGVVMGSTVIDRAIVSGLRNRIDTVEANAERRKQENDQLRTDLNRLQGAMGLASPYAVDRRLQGVPVAVVAARGVDANVVQAAVTLLQQAGATSPGVLWLEASWNLDTKDQVAAMSDIVTITERTPRTLRDAAFAIVAGRANGQDAARLPVTSLASAGFVKYEAIGDAGKNTTLNSWGAPGSRLMLIDGPNARITARDWLASAARAATAQRIPTVAAEIFAKTAEATSRGTRLAAVYASPELGSVTTVDDLDLVEGQLASVLATAEVGRGIVGRYGYGDGATRSMPVFAGS